MGKWAQVRCRCEASCIHVNGNLIETSPGHLLAVGALLNSIFRDSPGLFEIYPRIADPNQYADERLEIDVEGAALWKLETGLIRKALAGVGGLPYQKVEKLVQEWNRNECTTYEATRERLHAAQSKAPTAGLLKLANDLQPREPTATVAVGNLFKALDDADNLCDASIETGQPVELLW